MKEKKPKRTRPLKHFSLSVEAIDRLREIAERSGCAESTVIDRLIRQAEMPRPLGENHAKNR